MATRLHDVTTSAVHSPMLSVPSVSRANGEMISPVSVKASGWEAMRAEQQRWARWPVDSRLKIIARFRHLLADRAEGLAERLSFVIGTSAREILVSQILPLADACRFVERSGVRLLEPRRWKKWGRPAWLAGLESEVHREPHGIVLILGPSNYPLLLPGVQMVQALTAGNAVVLKPGLGGEEAADEISLLWREAGLPVALWKVLPATHEAGADALTGPIDHIVLTGSVDTGRQVLRMAAERILSSTMELSGSDAMVVRADADLELVVKAVWHALMLNQGATCIAPRKMLVHRHCEGQLSMRLAQWDGLTQTLPLPADVACILRERIQDALDCGAEVVRGGWNSRGELVVPLILNRVRPSLPIAQESTFIPILCLYSVSNDEEAIEWVRQSRYRLGASVFSASLSQAWEVAKECPVGVVTVNDLVVPTADPRIPFGGRGQSGFGVTRGAEGLLSMTCCKSILVRSGRDLPHLDPAMPGDTELFLSWIQWSHGGRWRNRIQSLKRLVGLLWERWKCRRKISSKH